jgi:hypothetical protein
MDQSRTAAAGGLYAERCADTSVRAAVTPADADMAASRCPYVAHSVQVTVALALR